MGRAVLDECDMVLVFGKISEGMRNELIEARQLDIPVYDGFMAITGKGMIPMEAGKE